MLSSALVALAMILLSPWWPDETPLQLSPEARLPVALVAASAEGATPEGLDVDHAVRQLVDGAAVRLRGRGLVVRPGKAGELLVMPPKSGGGGLARALSIGEDAATPDRRVALSVSLGSGTTPWSSGTETRFGGSGDASWRLAQQLQRHQVRGLWDVLGYDSYDRGVVEQREEALPEGSAGLQEELPWVATYPLFATNPGELALLESPETLDLLSSALANAIFDYLDPSLPTPERSARLGWRSGEPWQPVPPRVLWDADHGTRLALTFDGGASSAPTPAILNALREAGVRATMFMTAEFVEQNPELVVQMARDGHEFGNHSATHPDMTRLSDEEIVSQLDRLEKAVYTLTGRSTRPWFRPPYGAHDDRVARVVAEQGYYTVMWTADSADWREDVAPATVAGRLLKYAAPGAVLIEHLGSPQSAQVLPEVLAQLKERGFSFGTLSEVYGHNR
ncbi:MAG: polysaccharide deacetylase family protein [Chloroflexota bacterium]